MGLLRSLFRSLTFIFEVIYYTVVGAMVYMSVKAAECRLRRYRSSGSVPTSKKQKPQFSLVLDLDDTIIRTVRVRKGKSDISVPIPIGERILYYEIFKRPHLNTFLEEMQKHYEIVLYSTSQKEYVDTVLNYAGIGHLFNRKFYRNNCIISSDGGCMKALHKVRSDMSKVVLIDHSIQDSIAFPENFVPIDSWFGSDSDTALLDIMPFLEALSRVEDVRHILDLRCNDPRTYSLIQSARRRSNEHAKTCLSPYSPCKVAELSNDDANWNAIGQRLTSKAKQIFDTIDTQDGFHVQRPPSKCPETNKSK